MCFKYPALIRDLGIECPPNGCSPEKRNSFRIVKGVDHKDNFLPPLIIKPQRRHSETFKNDPSELCSGYALSFFVSLDSVREYFAELLEQMSNAHKSVGTHVAKGALDECDGVMSEPDEDGHFDLHEFEGAVLKPKFSIVHEL
jgi:hypothetical protein